MVLQAGLYRITPGCGMPAGFRQPKTENLMNDKLSPELISDGTCHGTDHLQQRL